MYQSSKDYEYEKILLTADVEDLKNQLWTPKPQIFTDDTQILELQSEIQTLTETLQQIQTEKSWLETSNSILERERDEYEKLLRWTKSDSLLVSEKENENRSS